MQPENLKPFIAVFSNVFKQNFLARLEDLKLMFHGYFDPTYAALDTELFQPDIEKNSGAYIAAGLELKQRAKHRHQWEPHKAEVFIKSLIATESTSVHEMASAGLLAMYYHPALVPMLERELQKKRYLPRVQRRLRQIAEAIRSKYLNKQKIYFRQLLVRYYGAKDSKALEEIFHSGSGIDCLCRLLADPDETAIIRWFAARALLDLRQIEGYRRIKQYAVSSDNLSKMLANAALIADKKPAVTASAYAEVADHASPFIRSIVARYAPLSNHKLLTTFLDDCDRRVQVYAAARLRSSSNIKVEQVLNQASSDKQPLVRLYAISSLWDMATLKKCLSKQEYRLRRSRYEREYLRSLIAATSDSDSRVRRIAILRLGELGIRKNSKIIADHLQDKDELVRLQTVITLSIRLELEQVVPILCDPKEKLLFRAAVLLGGMQVKKRAPTRLLGLLGTLLRDPDYRLRTLLIWGMGKAGKGTGVIIVRSYLSNRDPYMRLGALCAMIDDGAAQDIPRVIKMLKDPHPDTRFAAAAAAVRLADRHNDSKALAQIERLMHDADAAVHAGAALGYARTLYDRVKISSDSSKLAPEDNYRQFVLDVIHKMRQIDYRLRRRNRKSGDRSILELLHYFDKAVKLAPDNHRYRFERGVLYYLHQQYRESIADITAALKLKPQFPMARYMLARVYFLMNKDLRAMAILESYLHDFPWEINGLELKKQILDAQEKQEQARQVHYQLALIKGANKVIENIR